jgi:hypothetical protein
MGKDACPRQGKNCSLIGRKMTTTKPNKVVSFLFASSFLYFFIFGPYLELFGPKFIASDLWLGIGALFYIALMLYFLFKLLRQNQYEEEIYAIRSPLFDTWKEKLIALCLLLLTLIFFGPIGFIKAPGTMATIALGSTYKEHIPFEKLDSNCGERGKLVDLFLSESKAEFCLEDMHFSLLKESGLLTIKGKKSFFGRTVSGYALANGSFHKEERSSIKFFYFKGK